MQRFGRKKEKMGGGRKQIFLGLGLVMVMGLAVYLRLWTIDYNFSSNETELLRYLSSSCFLFILPQKDHVFAPRNGFSLLFGWWGEMGVG